MVMFHEARANYAHYKRYNASEICIQEDMTIYSSCHVFALQRVSEKPYIDCLLHNLSQASGGGLGM